MKLPNFNEEVLVNISGNFLKYNESLIVMGLIDYDFWELCRRTRTMCMEDYFWLSKGEKYEEVHIRFLAEHNRINETPITWSI